MSDRRERNHQWWERFDERSMRFTIEVATDDGFEEREFPAKFEVCETCDGKGTHVNPSIDSHGLSAEDFAEDPDFKEAYFSGCYDVTCAECHGARVVPVPDLDRMSAEDRKAVEDVQDAFYQTQREMAHERLMGY